VYPAPNACWQLDATEYVLTGGRKCVIFQLIDDHSRYTVASHVASSETAQAAIAVFDKAVGTHDVPQRLLSDNGLAKRLRPAPAPTDLPAGTRVKKPTSSGSFWRAGVHYDPPAYGKTTETSPMS